ncbi:MAG TPA: hypothetical protein VLH15_09075, partial [Dehalococcoidales bacterium]|nr:hypothetical protein [Dehalococcoidales bacterium]
VAGGVVLVGIAGAGVVVLEGIAGAGVVDTGAVVVGVDAQALSIETSMTTDKRIKSAIGFFMFF